MFPDELRCCGTPGGRNADTVHAEPCRQRWQLCRCSHGREHLSTSRGAGSRCGGCSAGGKTRSTNSGDTRGSDGLPSTPAPLHPAEPPAGRAGGEMHVKKGQCRNPAGSCDPARPSPVVSDTWQLGHLLPAPLHTGASPMLQVSAVRPSPGKLQQSSSMRDLQWPPRDPHMPREIQGEGSCPPQVPQLLGTPPCVEPHLSYAPLPGQPGQGASSGLGPGAPAISSHTGPTRHLRLGTAEAPSSSSPTSASARGIPASSRACSSSSIVRDSSVSSFPKHSATFRTASTYSLCGTASALSAYLPPGHGINIKDRFTGVREGAGIGLYQDHHRFSGSSHQHEGSGEDSRCHRREGCLPADNCQAAIARHLGLPYDTPSDEDTEDAFSDSSQETAQGLFPPQHCREGTGAPRQNATRTDGLTICQWNCNGARSKYATLLEVARLSQVDIFLLQETLLPDSSTFKVPGYHSYLLPRIHGESRGCAILVRHHLDCEEVLRPVECGEGVEVQAVTIRLPALRLKVYNIYRSANTALDLRELFALASAESLLLAGDFNSHHPFLQSPGPSNAAGIHLFEAMEDSGGVSLLNDVTLPTHIGHGRLDLSFVSDHLLPFSSWALHPTLTSDHFGVLLHLCTATLPPPQPLPPRYNLRLADWANFHDVSEATFVEVPAPDLLDDREAFVADSIIQAANVSIPLAKPHSKSHRDHWIYSSRLKEINHRVNAARRAYRRRPSAETRQYLQAVVRHATITKSGLREAGWLEWCRSLSAHTTVREMWKKIRTIYNPRPTPPPTHPDPLGEAERLAAHFATRTSPTLLPAAVQARQRELTEVREQVVRTACSQATDTDLPFTSDELEAALRRKADTAPGADRVSYSMLSHLGNSGRTQLLGLFNQSLREGRLPRAWLTAIIHPIPKPKEPGALRPISLLSCLGKVMERMIQSRLTWKVGRLHPSLFAYQPDTGTTDCLVTLLGTLRQGRGLVVFLDLEKAFELANPAVILATLADKGVAGHLLQWVRSFLTGRGARVRFQGHLSSRHAHVHGTPQGSILSPFLFNILMERLLDVPYGHGVRLLCYADDLALVFPRRNCFRLAPIALARLQGKCIELGLKVNPAKSRVMTFGLQPPELPFLFDGAEIQYTTLHQYLGIWLDSQLSFKKHVRYLKDRAAARTRALKSISYKGAGASFTVRRTFYMYAIRSIIDYSAPCLPGLKSSLLTSLEVIQNDALRAILGAPMWTPLPLLRAECGLPSLGYRIYARTSTSVAKYVRKRPDTPLTNQLLGAFHRPVNLTPDRDWIHRAVDAIRVLGVSDAIQCGPDVLHPDYAAPPPWVPHPISILRPNSARPRDALPTQLQQEGLAAVHHLSAPASITYYTDGSVSPDGTAGTAFVCGDYVHSVRVSHGVSAFQTELTAILLALRHARHANNRRIIIHTDSLSSLDALARSKFSDNTYLLSSIFHELHTLRALNTSIALHWLPGHVGIPGNERADRAARSAAATQAVTFHLCPSLSLLKSQANSAVQRLDKLALHDFEVQGSCSVAWYVRATRNEPLLLPPTVNSRVVKHLHRLRLGYRCASEVIGTAPDPCPYCFDVAEEPLIHYVLHCPATYKFRRRSWVPVESTRAAAASLLAIVPTPVLTDVVTSYPPPV